MRSLDDAGRALFRLGRLFNRPPSERIVGGRGKGAVELSRIAVVQTIEGAEGDHAEITVSVVAEALDIDPSTASRLVADTIRGGYVSRAASATDGRRASLTLTAEGRALADGARRFQREVFERATQDWPAREREEFALLFVRFADAVARVRVGR